MKKTNWIVYGIALAASLVLLGIWFFSGFSQEHALDLYIAIVWWIVIAASVIAINALSKKDAQASQKQESNPTMRI